MSAQPIQQATEPTKRAIINRILVPMDGSKESEAVVPYVEQIAGATSATVTLMTAIYVPITWTEFLTQIDLGKEVDVARTYLERQKSGLKERGLKTETSIAVVHGAPTKAILDFARVDKTDLIAMTTHGRSGVTRWAWGSVADKVLHSTHLPLLLVRPPAEGQRASTPIRKILVPLDASELAQSVLPFTQTLAKALGSSLVLMHAVGTPWTAYPGVDAPQFYDRALDELKESAHQFLARVNGEVARAGLRATQVVTIGSAVNQILNVAQSESVGLIAMSTHGHSGLGRWVMGSVADAVLRRTDLPCLLVRPPMPENRS